MKKSFCCIIILGLLTLGLNAQVSGGTSSVPDLSAKGYQSSSFPSGSIPAKITINGWVNSSSPYGDIILQPGLINSQGGGNGSIRANGSIAFPVYNNGGASISNISSGLSLNGANGINFSTSSGQAMKIASNGNIGIGTSSPDPNYNLTLYHTTNCGMLLDNGSFQWVIENTFDDGNQMAGCLSIRQNGIKRLLLYRDQSSIFGSDVTVFKNMTGPDKGSFTIDFSNSSHPNFEMLQLFNGNENKIFSIQQDGTMHLDGKIYAKEIEVKANVWADYVFKKDYKLLSIPELESFIKDNNRLPDVPSEAEAKEKGVNVGDMNALLLKKVEELTLYAIQQQKEIESLKNDIRSLKK